MYSLTSILHQSCKCRRVSRIYVCTAPISFLIGNADRGKQEAQGGQIDQRDCDQIGRSFTRDKPTEYFDICGASG
jgi:hypothetical protein